MNILILIAPVLWLWLWLTPPPISSNDRRTFAYSTPHQSSRTSMVAYAPGTSSKSRMSSSCGPP